MKKLIAFLLTFCLVLSFAACNNENNKPEEKEDGTTEPAVEALASGEWANKTGAFALKVVGAELFDDEDGNKAIRVYLDFTNKAGSYTTTYADEKDDTIFTQNGEELEKTAAVFGEDALEYGNNIRNIRPGVTIRVIEEYALQAETGNVKFTLTAPNQENDILTYDFDLAALPGAPEEALKINPIAAPDFNTGWAESGKCADYYDDEVLHEVAIKNAEFVEGKNGEKLIRVYFDFTNNDEDKRDLFRACDLRIFQDGIQLKEGQAKTSVDEEKAFSSASEPGVKVSVANSYILISDSPVEVEIYDAWNEAGIAKVFNVG